MIYEYYYQFELKDIKSWCKLNKNEEMKKKYYMKIIL